MVYFNFYLCIVILGHTWHQSYSLLLRNKSSTFSHVFFLILSDVGLFQLMAWFGLSSIRTFRGLKYPHIVPSIVISHLIKSLINICFVEECTLTDVFLWLSYIGRHQFGLIGVIQGQYKCWWLVASFKIF